MTRWGRFKCWVGCHDWDGNIEIDPKYGHVYPAPRCRRCGKWHHRDTYNAADYDAGLHKDDP